jgi:hypothetical protein
MHDHEPREDTPCEDTERTQQEQDEAQAHWQRFQELGRKLFAVPKSEVDALREQEREERGKQDGQDGDTA